MCTGSQAGLSGHSSSVRVMETSTRRPDQSATHDPDVDSGWTTERAEIADRVIKAMAGPDAALRDDQRVAVAALTRAEVGSAGSRVLVVQATGWGKSAVYWAATTVRRAEGAGPTLVVSPLLSLMRDQVAAAGKAGLRAATLNSANIDAWSQVEADLLAGTIDVLLVSPERLANPGFGRRVLDALAGRLGLLVIDEAHSVSDWGHDFRPDYRRVSDVLQRLNPATPVLATTATANQRVTDDVAAQLGEATLVLRGPLARASLELSVVGDLSPLQRYAWVVDHLPELPGSGIVYALTVADAERLTEAVRTVHGDQVAVAAYTGRLDAATRERLEDELRDNRLKALIATSALGMGYDKPDLGFVVHVGAPPSPVSYYQQVGRAGRAIDHAHAVLLPSRSDQGVWDYFATATIPRPTEVEAVLTVLSDSAEAMSVPALEAQTGVRRTRVELLLKQLAVEEVVERVEGGWRSTGAPWSYDAEHYDAVVAVRRREAGIMRDYVDGAGCLMELLQRSLDDPHAERCGRCSVCRGGLPEGLSEQPLPETVTAVSGVLKGHVQVLEPRKMWPGGAFGSRGRIQPDEAAEEGRVLIHADAPEWAEVLDSIRRGDGSASQDVLDGVVRVLAGWRSSWAARPELVIGLAVAGRPQLLGSVADHVASVGRLDRLDLVAAPVATEDASSAEEAAWWRDQLTSVVAGSASSLSGRTVLLVLDRSATGWPATVAASLLRQAGAARVLPLLLHRTI